MCAGRIALADAQHEIATDWVAAAGLGASTPAPTVPPTASPAATTAPPPATFNVTITASRYGFVAATTSAVASCTARALLPSGNYSQAQGITVTRVADANGGVSWSYTTVSTTKPGTGTHTMTCTLNGQTTSASASFTVP